MSGAKTVEPGIWACWCSYVEADHEGKDHAYEAYWWKRCPLPHGAHSWPLKIERWGSTCPQKCPGVSADEPTKEGRCE